PSAIGYAVDQLGQNDLRSIQTTQWSRDNNGELMVGKWGTWSIDNTDMESIYGADWRDNDPTGVRKQLHEGGFQSIDAWVRQESYDLQKRSAGLSFASANLSYAFQTGIGLQGYNTINPQTGKAFDLPQGGFWGVQDKQFALQGRQQEYNFAYQERELALSDEYWHQNMGLQQRQAGMQRTWAQEDWAYQDQRRNLSWQWKQEDFQENVRFMTGRQRKLAERNMERDTIVQNLETEQIDTKRERQEELWALEDERFEINTNYHETQMAHQEERLDKMRQFYEEGRVLQKQQMELSKAYFIEQNALQRASAALQMDQAEFQKTIADDLEKARIEAENKQATLEAQQKTWTQTLTWIEKTLVDLPAKIKQKIEQELGITVGQVPYTGNWVGPGDRGEDSPRSERPTVNVFIDGEDIYSRTEQNIGDRL
ncbi:MAG: hypothetical protein U9N61_11965, partial [Euryarchaeota archaeon]|nr:hypothetical protein [Euryarchaeota archaeon]